MAPGKSTEIKVGIVTILSIILFIVGISLGTGLDVSSNMVDIRFRFENSAGIKQSDPIVVNGVKRGYVTSVNNDNGTVMIKGKVNRIDDLYSDLTAKITLLEITGGKKIEISPGKDKVKFNPKNTIPGVQTSDFGNLLLVAGALAGNLQHLVLSIDTVASSANMLLADGKVVKDIRYSVAKSREIVDNISGIIKSNRSSLNESVKNLRYITERLKDAIDKDEPRLDTLLATLQEVADKTGNILKKVDGTVSETDNLILDLRKIAESVKTGDGLVSRLLYDKEMGKQVDEALKSVQNLVKMIDKYGMNVNVRVGTRP